MSTKLTKDQWVEILLDHKTTLEENTELFMAIYRREGHKAFYKQLKGTLSKDPRAQPKTHAKRIRDNYSAKYTIELEAEGHPGGEAWWLFFDGKKEKGHWSWALKPNLVDAIKELYDSSNNELHLFFDNELENVIYIEGETEGRKVQYFTTKYERSQKNRDEAIKAHGLTCCVCGFNFEDAYGKLGEKYIEVHHNKPLYSNKEETRIVPKTDLNCVCANCHRMLHRKKDRVLSVDDLRRCIKKPIDMAAPGCGIRTP